MKFMKMYHAFICGQPYLTVLATYLWDYREYKGKLPTKHQTARILQMPRATVQKYWDEARSMCNCVHRELQDERLVKQAKAEIKARDKALKIRRGGP